MASTMDNIKGIFKMLRENSKEKPLVGKEDVKDNLKVIKARGYFEAIKKDCDVLSNAVNKGKESENSYTRRTAEVIERIGYAAGASNMVVAPDKKNGVFSDNPADKHMAAEVNSPPIASYFAGGGRPTFTLPPGSGHKLIDYFVNGKREAGDPVPTDFADIVSAQRKGPETENDSSENKKLLFTRDAGTHDMSIKTNEKTGKVEFKEKKVTKAELPLYGLKVVSNMVNHGNDSIPENHHHFAVNANIQPLPGKTFVDPNKAVTGQHGQIYFHYVPATATTAGSLQVGFETCASTGAGVDSKHSMLGSASKTSVTDNSKKGEMDRKIQEHNKTVPEKEKVVSPGSNKYGAVAILFHENPNMLNEICNTSQQEIPSDIFRRNPAKDITSLKKQNLDLNTKSITKGIEKEQTRAQEKELDSPKPTKLSFTDKIRNLFPKKAEPEKIAEKTTPTQEKPIASAKKDNPVVTKSDAKELDPKTTALKNSESINNAVDKTVKTSTPEKPIVSEGKSNNTVDQQNPPVPPLTQAEILEKTFKEFVKGSNEKPNNNRDVNNKVEFGDPKKPSSPSTIRGSTGQQNGRSGLG